MLWMQPDDIHSPHRKRPRTPSEARLSIGSLRRSTLSRSSVIRPRTSLVSVTSHGENKLALISEALNELESFIERNEVQSGKVNISELSRQCKLRLRELQRKLNQISQEDILSGDILEEARSQIAEIYEHRQDAERRASQFALERNELEHKIQDLNVSHKSNIHTLVEELARLKDTLARYERLGDIESIENENSKKKEDYERQFRLQTEKITQLEGTLRKKEKEFEQQREVEKSLTDQLNKLRSLERMSSERADRLEKEKEDKCKELDSRDTAIRQLKMDLADYKRFGDVKDLERKLLDRQNLDDQRAGKDRRIEELEGLLRQKDTEIEKKNLEINEKQAFHAHVNIQLEDIERSVQESNDKIMRLTEELEKKTDEANELQSILEKQKTELANLDKDMQAELNAKDEQIDQLKEELTKRDKNFIESTLEIENLRTHVSQQDDELAELLKTNSRVLSELDEKDDEINKLRDQLFDKHKADSDLQSALSKKNDDISKLQHQLVDLRKAHTGIQTALLEKDELISKLQHRFTDLDKENLELQSVTSEKDNQLSKLRQQLVEAKSEIQTLRKEDALATSQTKERNETIKRLEQNLTDATGQIQDLVQLLEKRNRELSNIEHKLDAVTKRLDHANSQSNAAINKVNELEHALAIKSKDIVELQKSKDALKEREEILTRDMRRKHEENERMADSIAKKDDEISELKMHVATLSRDVQQYKRNDSLIKEKTQEVRRLEATIEEQTERIYELEEKAGNISSLEEALDERAKIERYLEQELENLQNEFFGAQDEIKRLKNTISEKNDENRKLAVLCSENTEREQRIMTRLQSKEKEVQKLHDAIAEKKAEITEAKQAHADASMKLEAAVRQAKQSQERIASLEGEVEDVARAYALVEERSARISQLEHTVEMIQADLSKAIQQRCDVEEKHSVLQIRLDQSHRKIEKLEAALVSEQQSNKENVINMEQIRKRLEDEKMDLQVELRRTENNLEKERIEIRRLKDALQILSEYTQQALAERS
ncbi:hypothetical protein EC973_007674 [Apophysomyces ossiformis]|uniref:t-SNARE coiled-coil homology domain-containing protein n=1 Tax=Apophysomyces ossiformis TaxID=679940 RepID=A0A8H7BYQ5_9FUNG|nr:hypothetical protein EC973_007674 [Apophysomyces ossiformis]